jgi:hypothetical protein
MFPEKIGRYTVKNEVGRGGMATVYAAHDPLSNRDVAIKLLPSSLMHDANFRTRFEREAKIIASLEHPAIVPVYDFGEENEAPYFVMRLMGGGSLDGRLVKGPLPLAEVARIMSIIGPALDYAHAQGIVHRDLKPGNILFDQHGQPYLSDFGIAKLSEGGTSLTGNSIVGTPAYMSPEQARGEGGIDGRSDNYSLGVIIFEMLTGRVPFEADTPMGQVMMHITKEVPNLRSIRPDLPSACQTIINRAMAKKKLLRYETAAEMAHALAAVVANQSLTPDGLARADAARPGARARPSGGRTALFIGLGVGMLALVGLLLAAVLVLPGLLKGTPTAVAQVSDTAAPTMVAATATQALAPTDTPAPALSPQPSPTAEAVSPTETPTVETSVLVPTTTPAPTDTPLPTATATPAYPVIGGADMIAFLRDNDVWVARLDGSELRRLTNTGGAKSDLQWSADGQAVLFVAGRCAQSVDINTGGMSTLMCVNWASYLASFRLSPDGKYVAASLSDGLYILPYDPPTLSQIKRQDQLKTAQNCIAYTEIPTKAVRWSADGTALAVVVVGTDAGSQVELVRVLNVSKCGQAPVRMDEFPGARFEPRGYRAKPVIESFGWDGSMVFAMNINTLNGFGDFYTYNMSSLNENLLTPINNQCCYRDFQWSPDGQYILFAFQDIRYGKAIQLYLVPYGTIDTGEQFTALPFPESLWTNPKEEPQPVLRPAR